MGKFRRLAGLFVRTPLHPQWLLGRRRPPDGLAQMAGRILDIGAADRWIQHQVPAAAWYVALDYPATGRELYGAGPDVFADGAHLPFQDASFDGVVCLEVIEHVAAPQRVIAEIQRVLRPGGRGWISMPFLYPVHDAPFDFQRYTEFGLRRDVVGVGLEITALRRSLPAVRSAGLLACLAIAGPVSDAQGLGRWLRLPFATLAVLLINVATWAVSWAWPDWRALTAGYDVEVRKP